MFTEKNIKMWSRVGSRATFGLVMLELGEEIDELAMLSADTSTSAGLDRFKNKFPDKYVEVGIAEQNMIGIAAGLASEGFNVVTTTFSPFQTMRCLDQIRVNVAYMNHSVCMVGLASGLVLGHLGFSHCCIEDLSIMRSLPGVDVLSPADATETVKAVRAGVASERPTYIRLTGGSATPIVYSGDYDFQIGRGIRLREGDLVSIIATGSLVHTALEAAELLNSSGVSASVVNLHTVKPIDDRIINEEFSRAKLVVVVEEHNVIGGLASAVSEVAASKVFAAPLVSIGIDDRYGPAGSYESLLQKNGLTKTGIVDRVLYELDML